MTETANCRMGQRDEERPLERNLSPGRGGFCTLRDRSKFRSKNRSQDSAGDLARIGVAGSGAQMESLRRTSRGVRDGGVLNMKDIYLSK